MRLLCSILLCLAGVCCYRLVAQDLYDDTRILELRIEFAQPNWQQVLRDNVATETDIPTTLTVNGVRYDSIGIRYKGNSSYNIPGDKKPFNLSMDTYKPDQLLMGYKTLNLNNGFKDPSFVREKIAYDLAARYMPAAKAAFVKVYINNQYWGLYLNVQQPNKTFLREWFGTADGNYYKCDPRGDLMWMNGDTARYKSNYEKKNEENADWSDLVELTRVLNTASDAEFMQAIEQRLNIDRALWYMAYCNILSSLDSYIGSGHNYYIYHNPTDNLFTAIPWDMNEVIGVFQMNMSIQQLEQLSVFYGEQNQARPLLRRLLRVPEYRQRYLAHLRTMIREVLDNEYWSARIKTLQDLIRTDVQADTKKLYTMELFDRNVTENVQLGGMPGGFTVPGLKSFISNRKSYVASTKEFSITPPSILTVMHHPEKPHATDSVLIRAMLNSPYTTTLWYSVNGKAYQRKAMADLNMGAIWYGVKLPPLPAGTVVRYYVAAANDSAVIYSPEYTEHQPLEYVVEAGAGSSPVVINELLASNKNGTKDPQGDYEDWFELYNTSDTEIDLSGKYMTDDNLATRWKFPAGTSIAPKGYLLVWADEDTTDTPGLHANFKLSKSGEALRFYDTDANGNALLDSISFGAQGDDISLGRLPNGTGVFTSMNPTPGAENQGTTDVRDELGDLGAEWNLFPNPAQDAVELVFTVEQEKVQCSLRDILGNELFALEAIQCRNLRLPLNVVAGSYTLRVQTPTGVSSRRLSVVR